MAKAPEKKSTDFTETMERLDKTYGKGTVIRMGQKYIHPYDYIPSGSIGLDSSLGGHGYARKKMYELMGWEGSGKTTLCGEAIAQFQKKYPDEEVLYVDAEHALDKEYYIKLGVDVDKMLLCQPTSAEEAFNVAEEMMETGRVGLVIIDSDTSLMPDKEEKGEIGDNAIGLKAKLNSQAYKKYRHTINANNVCLIVISQFRDKIGVMFGPTTTTSGGNALRFYTDTRIELWKTVLKEDEQQYANEVRVKVTKNKVGMPYVESKFELVYGVGIDKLTEIMKLAKDNEIISQRKKDGINYITHGTDKYTEEEFIQLITDNEEFKTKLIEEIKAKL